VIRNQFRDKLVRILNPLRVGIKPLLIVPYFAQNFVRKPKHPPNLGAIMCKKLMPLEPIRRWEKLDEVERKLLVALVKLEGR
jgi:hypothetical protein